MKQSYDEREEIAKQIAAKGINQSQVKILLIVLNITILNLKTVSVTTIPW